MSTLKSGVCTFPSSPPPLVGSPRPTFVSPTDFFYRTEAKAREKKQRLDSSLSRSTPSPDASLALPLSLSPIRFLPPRLLPRRRRFRPLTQSPTPRHQACPPRLASRGSSAGCVPLLPIEELHRGDGGGEPARRLALRRRPTGQRAPRLCHRAAIAAPPRWQRGLAGSAPDATVCRLHHLDWLRVGLGQQLGALACCYARGG